MIVLALVVLGIVAYPSIGVDLFPKVDLPIVNIRTALKGASPEIMDIDVTDKIEEAVNTINGVKTITSTSTEGVSIITVEFVLERDIDLAVQDVREKISTIRSKLPNDIDEPVIEKVDPDATPVLWLTLRGRQISRTFRPMRTRSSRSSSRSINGVGAIRLYGPTSQAGADMARRGQAEGIRDDRRTTSPKALARKTWSSPADASRATQGILRQGQGRVPQGLRTSTTLWSPTAKAPSVRLKDVGRAEDGMEEKRSIARFNGISSIGIGIQKQSGTNTVEVVDRVKERGGEHRENPAGGHGPRRSPSTSPIFIKQLHQRGPVSPHLRRHPGDPRGLRLPAELADHPDQRAGPAGLRHRHLRHHHGSSASPSTT